MPTKVRLVKAMVFPVVMYGCESWAVKKAECRIDAFGHVDDENRGFHGGSNSKESACNARELGLMLESGRSPGEGHGNPLQYSCLDYPMDRGAWWSTVHRVTKS